LVLRRRGDGLSIESVSPWDSRGRDARRLARLHAELVDEFVPLPVDGPAGSALLTELFYALHPPVHEGRVPAYGAVVHLDVDADSGDGDRDGDPLAATGGTVPDGIPAASSRLDHRPDVELIGAKLDATMQRMAADGRSTFVWRSIDRPEGILTLARSHNSEADLVGLRERLGNVVVIQRSLEGRVRAVTQEGVVIWTGVDWVFKPVANSYLAPLARLLPDADRDVLDALLDLCVHGLSAKGVGATLVWWLDDSHPQGIDGAMAQSAYSLTVTDRRHHPALLSILAQVDRAVVVRRAGELKAVDVALLTSAESEARVAAQGGTRHSSARRYSYDQHRSVVFVVSADGPVSVFVDGASAAQVRVDPCRLGFTVARLDPDSDGQVVPCPACKRDLLVDVTDLPGWMGGPEVLPCPVCEEPITVDAYRAAIRGPVKLPAPQV
jgi:DNA integrity scanning protein DisA with diadenylate cyclase activity